jgi:hypothetical protein
LGEASRLTCSASGFFLVAVITVTVFAYSFCFIGK